MINNYDKHKILEKLPNIEISNDKIIYKKVFDVIDYYILVPDGQKSLLWFTHYNEDFLSILLILNDANSIIDFKVITTCFSDELALNNTIFLGNFFKMQSKETTFFAIIDIIYYNNQSYFNISYQEKFNTLNKIFNTQIKQINFNQNSTIIGLPKICNNLKNIELDKFNLIYNIKSVMYIKKNLSNNYGISYYYSNKEIYASFNVKADLQTDIYYIYLKNEKNFYDILLIDSYKTSVFMNNLFRKIKENKNLDLLEESDSDEEFENMNNDKFVNLDKQLIIKCKYYNKFRKWIPFEISNESIISRKDLFNILKK